jgi:phosphatidylserine decarboxylase
MSRRWPYRHLFEGRMSVGLGRLLGRLADLPLPESLLGPLVRAYVACVGVDTSQVLEPPDGFGTFGAFFARRLRPDARPVCGGPGSVVSPCDGVVVGQGRLEDGASSVVTVKGTRYSIRDLVGDETVARGLVGGGYCLLYLHPRDYHRVHAPVDGTLREVRHLPGARYPMAPWAAGFADGALGLNERLVFDLELPRERRRCVLLMVAAFGVGGMECQHLVRAEMQGRGLHRACLEATVRRGDELGAFRLGSTVALLWPAGAIELAEDLSVGGRVLTGRVIGRIFGR